MKKITACLIGVISITINAYEVDQFTDRDKVPADSTIDLNVIIREKLEKTIQNSNSEFFGLFKTDCNKNNTEARRILFENLRSSFVSETDIGILEKQIMKDEDIDKRRIHVDQSVYVTAQNNNIILKGILNSYGLAPVIKVNNVQIGTDKLGHFFNEGYGLYLQSFSQSDENKRNYNTTIFNQALENNYYGLKTTGIKSYGDLTANYEGYQFWNRLCGKVYKNSTAEEKKYFAEHKCTKDAYIRCDVNPDTKKGTWAINKMQTFRLEDYVSPAWDESINCNKYSKAIEKDVLSELSRRVYTYKGDPKNPCPAEPDKCKEIIKRYPGKLDYLISEACKSKEEEAKSLSVPSKKSPSKKTSTRTNR